MSTWNIDVAGVSVVLTVFSDQLGIEGGGLAETIDSTADGIDMALDNAKSPPVEIALAGLFEHYTGETDGMFLKSLSCLQGASDATLAYNDGQHEMALEAQRTAGDVSALGLEGGEEPFTMGGPR
ncbi:MULTISPECIES: DUF6507 family protein [unclassified Nocardiopsis]|uniref:DUF6507 family protein n=1 Tax=unclassified Nocardiopsis TaxID=2649073 RepID=UPI00135709B4|nr:MULTISPECIES: DUF6507 family protein [unclassified Nocardiopsis]